MGRLDLPTHWKWAQTCWTPADSQELHSVVVCGTEILQFDFVYIKNIFIYNICITCILYFYIQYITFLYIYKICVTYIIYKYIIYNCYDHGYLEHYFVPLLSLPISVRRKLPKNLECKSANIYLIMAVGGNCFFLFSKVWSYYETQVSLKLSM